jgi:hypothetical protein
MDYSAPLFSFSAALFFLLYHAGLVGSAGTRSPGHSICHRDRVRLSSLAALCYHQPWDESPSWADREPVEQLQTHRVLRMGGRPSHLIFRERLPSTHSGEYGKRKGRGCYAPALVRYVSPALRRGADGLNPFTMSQMLSDNSQAISGNVRRNKS